MREKIRVQNIAIDLPTEESTHWLRATLQRAMKDDDWNTVQLVDRVGYVIRSIPDTATQMVTITDPVTKKQITASVAGAASLIKELMCMWTIEDLSKQGKHAFINSYGDIEIKKE
jgi:S-adenosylmethionine hydrolase